MPKAKNTLPELSLKKAASGARRRLGPLQLPGVVLHLKVLVALRTCPRVNVSSMEPEQPA